MHSDDGRVHARGTLEQEARGLLHLRGRKRRPAGDSPAGKSCQDRSARESFCLNLTVKCMVRLQKTIYAGSTLRRMRLQYAVWLICRVLIGPRLCTTPTARRPGCTHRRAASSAPPAAALAPAQDDKLPCFVLQVEFDNVCRWHTPCVRAALPPQQRWGLPN